MKARRILWFPLVLVIVLLPVLALNSLCEQVVYDDNGVGGEDCGNMFPDFHRVLPRGEELAMFDCGSQTRDSEQVLVLLYAATSGHRHPIYAELWEVPTSGAAEGLIEFPSGKRRCSMSIDFHDADVHQARPGDEVCG